MPLVLFWYLSILWLGKYQLLGVAASPILSVILFQGIAYFVDGDLDPFFIITSFFSLLWCIAVTAALEFVRRKVAPNLFRKLRASRPVATIVGLIILMASISPSVMVEYDKIQFRAETDKFMLAEAKKKAVELLSKRMSLPEGYRLGTTYERSDFLYEISFVYKDKEFAIVKLSSANLKELSVQIVDDSVFQTSDE